MKTNVERIVDFLKRFDIDEAVFEKRAGLGNAAIKNNLKNKGKFSDKSLEKILTAYPEIRKEWLYMGEGKMLITDTDETKKPDQTDQAEIENLKKEVDRLKNLIIHLTEELHHKKK